MKKEHMLVLLEDINAKFDFVLESIVPDVRALKSDMREMKIDMRSVKNRLEIVEVLYRDHENRIKHLEAGRI